MPLNPRGWAINIVPSVVVIAAATFAAVRVDRPWSWPLFVWAVALGVVAMAWAYGSTLIFGRRMARRASGAERERLETRISGLWARQRAVYAGGVLMCIGVGVFAAGLHLPAIDILLTVVWVLAGLVPPLVAGPMLMKRYGAMR